MKKNDSGLVAVLVFALAKGAKLLKSFKALTALKFLKTFGSMLASIFAYSFGMGWEFATGFVLLMFIHELGHVAANKRLGIKSSWPMFIPFLGAIIFVPPFKNRKEEAISGYGGPLAGTVASVVLYGAWAVTPGHPAILLALSYVSAFLNLFNLIPIRPLDGGRVAQILGGWTGYVGFALLAGYVIYERDLELIFLVMLVLINTTVFPVLGFAACVVGSLFLIAHLFATSPGAVRITFDLAFLLLFNSLLYGKMKACLEKKQRGFTEKEMPPEPMHLRVAWAMLYLGLAGILCWLMSVQSPILHQYALR